jgi:lipopolysaccharide transport system ATP-binding protein
VGEAVRLEISALVHRPLQRLVVGYMIKDCFGQAVYGTNTHHLGQVLTDLKAGSRVTFQFDFTASLGAGSYSLAVALTDSDSHLSANYEWRDLALVFKMINLDQPVFSGCAWLPPTTRITVS